MHCEIISEQIISNNDYSLSLFTKGITLTLKLKIKVSKIRTDVYQKILNSLKDVEKLQENFESLQDFKQFIIDVRNIDINLEKKTIRLIKTYTKKFIQIASVPLQFTSSIVKNPEDELIQQILERCAQKKELTCDQVKSFLGNIAVYISQQKKQSKHIYQEQDHQMLNLKNQVEAKWTQCHEEKQKCLSLIKNIDQKIGRIKQKQAKILKQLDQLEEEKLNKSQIAEMRVVSERINKQVELIKINMEKDINVLGMRVERVEKLLEKIELNKKENEFKKEEKIKFSEKKEKIYKQFDITNWVDPDCKWFNRLVLNGSAITAKQYANVFGRNKIEGVYTFTTTFSKINYLVQLGAIDTSNKNKSIWNNNFVCYQNNSFCQVGDADGGKKGSGFKTNEKVTIAIDLIEGSILWQVGSQIRHQETVPMLKDDSISWVPYIWLGSKDDSVEISEE